MRHQGHDTPPAAVLIFAAVAALTTVLATPAWAVPEAARGGHDIGALMAAAEEHYDLTELDAALLLEQTTVCVAQGERSTTIHRIVWFSTELGSDTYADLRVPYNTETSTLTVETLRTWMDGRWWPHESDISPTAVVATTPGALQSADDYITMRETMLLHDGVELPCIVETVYTITERIPTGHGSDGLWLFPKADPAVLTILAVDVPSGTTLHHAELNGAPSPEMTTGEGSDSYVWRAEFTDRLDRPLVADAAAYVPCAVWSTWDNWDALAEALMGSMEEAAVLNAALTDTIARLVAAKPLALARAQAVVEFVNETTRAVRYDDSFWRFAPRAAKRTWATAYGHGLDRAVLAEALFEEVSCAATPVFTGVALEGADAVPALARFERVMLWVHDTGAHYDPLQGTLSHGEAQFAGSCLWTPGSRAPETVRAPAVSGYELVLSLESDGEGGWTGSGVLDTDGALSAYENAVGIDGETGGHLGRVARTALDGAELEEHSLVRLERDRVAAGFSFTLEAPEPDQSGRTRLEMGDPTGGIADRLPSDVHLYAEHRDSPVRLSGAMEQTITLVLEPGERELVRVPEPRSLTNAAGSFRLTVERGADRTTITRALDLTPDDVGDRVGGVILVRPNAWPDLRALLLEEADHRNRVLLLE